MILESLRLALRALSANKLRAALTMLGMTIGVAAVITLVSVGNGVSRYIEAQFAGLGTNVLFIFPGVFRPGGGPPGARTGGVALTESDWLALSDPARVPGAAAVVPQLRRNATAVYGRTTVQAPLRGTTPEYLAARNYKLLSGRPLNATDLQERERVALLGQTTLDHLFEADEDPLGATIRLNGQPFRVVGLLDTKGATPFGDEDDVVVVPYTTMSRLFPDRTPSGEHRVTLIVVQAVDPQRQDELITQITDVLRDEHNIPYRGEDDFTVLSEQDLLSAFQQVTGAITLFLGAIAGISLLVGGIGIMNIMLVSVTERTKEIGLRKAVGAKRVDVLTQFLVEAMVLSVAGGVLGIVLGAAGAWGIRLAVPDLDTSVTVDSVTLATGFAAGVGLFFGMYPAVRASGLNPIEALRYE